MFLLFPSISFYIIVRDTLTKHTLAPPAARWKKITKNASVWGKRVVRTELCHIFSTNFYSLFWPSSLCLGRFLFLPPLPPLPPLLPLLPPIVVTAGMILGIYETHTGYTYDAHTLAASEGKGREGERRRQVLPIRRRVGIEFRVEMGRKNATQSLLRFGQSPSSGDHIWMMPPGDAWTHSLHYRDGMLQVKNRQICLCLTIGNALPAIIQVMLHIAALRTLARWCRQGLGSL